MKKKFKEHKGYVIRAVNYNQTVFYSTTDPDIALQMKEELEGKFDVVDIIEALWLCPIIESEPIKFDWE
jgi:hypothetical protein